ncbi:MAG TPA: MarR family transcriptional regulator [Polyangiaceae bacterium]
MYILIGVKAPWNVDQQLCFALYASSRALVRAYDPLLAPLGITYPQYLVMLVLWEEDGRTVNGIGEKLDLDSGTLTSLLKRLEARGLVTRKRDATDERVVRVSLTKEGLALRPKASAILKDVACEVGITLAEAVALRETLHGISRRLAERASAAKIPPTKNPKRSSPR